MDSILSQDLQAVGGVLIEGARGCGKTETGLQHAQSFFWSTAPRVSGLAQALVNAD
ncbi:hypothetical protein HMPREF0294_2268 [Corynebacterium glucuronolyticum ATCC 51867]|nr:hypothetical protein HMPREF0294_2268 [Corynebacterium glucuronolyticum ATCC 51867]